MKTKYVTKIKLYQEARTKEIASNKFGDRILNPLMINEIGRHFLRGDTKETMLVLAMNTKNELIAVYPVFTGTINTMVVSPREIMQFALLNNAFSIALIHNHPSGNSEPSDEDIDFTRRVAMAGDLLNIALLDHLVITDDDYSSIKVTHDEIFHPTSKHKLLDFLVAETAIDPNADLPM